MRALPLRTGLTGTSLKISGDSTFWDVREPTCGEALTLMVKILGVNNRTHARDMPV